MREPSVFELIVEGKIPSTKIREDEEFMAILDLFPNCKWQTLVIPKQRYESDISLMPSDVYTRYMLATQHVMQLLKQWLGVERIGMIVEWMWVHHAHIKLYPMYWINAELKEMEVDNTHEKVWFDKYAWYLTSKIGEMKPVEELERIAQEIAKNST